MVQGAKGQNSTRLRKRDAVSLTLSQLSYPRVCARWPSKFRIIQHVSPGNASPLLRVSSGRHTQSYSVYYLLLWIWKMAGTWTCTTFFSESGRSPPHESSATLNIHSVYGLMLIRTRLCFCKACICLLSYINASGSQTFGFCPCFITCHHTKKSRTHGAILNQHSVLKRTSI